MNNFKVTLLMVGLIVLFCAVGYLLGGLIGLFGAFFFASLLNLGSYWFSDKVVLKMYKAKEVTENENSRLFRIVRTITTKSVMPMPKVYIVPSKAPNAFATGRNQEHAAVAATEGILEILSDAELEGVIGHELAHIKNKDMLIGTIAATFAGAIGILASIARWGAIFGGYSRSDNRGGGIGLLIGAIVAPLAAMVIQMAISRQREFKADAEGAKMTNRYNELASALKKLHSSPIKLNLDKNPATAHLMIANPLSSKKRFRSMFSTHPPVEERIQRLQKLAGESLYQGYANIG